MPFFLSDDQAGNLACISVKTSASVANLGAGYDCLALSLDLMNSYDLYFEDAIRIDDGSVRSPELQLGGRYVNDDQVKIGGDGNLFWAAFRTSTDFFFERENKELPKRKFFIQQSIDIPPKRGLGSSSSASVAGVVAAAEYFWLHHRNETLLGFQYKEFKSWNAQELLEWFVTIAHDVDNCPDNICASLVGGLTAAMVVPRGRSNEARFVGEVRFLGQSVSEDLGVVALVPSNPISTSIARKVLSKLVQRSDAVSNLQRSSLAMGFFKEQRYELFHELMWDELHQQQRATTLYCDADERKSLDFEGLVSEMCKNEYVYSVCIGGAGSTLVAFCAPKHFEDVSDLFAKEFKKRAPDGWNIDSCRGYRVRNEAANVDVRQISKNELSSQPGIEDWYRRLRTLELQSRSKGWIFD